MDETQHLPQITDYIRKLDSNGYRLIVYKDCLWSAKAFGKGIKQWNCEGKCIRTLRGPTYHITSLFIWRDCLYAGYEGNIIIVWNIITGQCVRQLIGHNGYVSALTEWRGSLISGSN